MPILKRQMPLILFAAMLVTPGAGKTQEPTQKFAPTRILYSEAFNPSSLRHWRVYGAHAAVENRNGTPALRTEGDCQVFLGAPDDKTKLYQDATIEGDVSVEREGVSSGFIFRASKQTNDNTWKGYYACLRKVGGGYAVVQLFRLPEMTLLQEARVVGEVSLGQRIHLKMTGRGSALWVWANHMNVPALTEFDDKNTSSGFVGLKAEGNKGSFANVVVSTGGRAPRAPCVRDWSWIKGAVFITSESVNSYQMWEEYHPQVIERELSYARGSGLNTVQVYLNFLMWQKYGPVYLHRIEDFLKRADEQNLKVTFVLFDDVGNIEPPHLSPYDEPVPGVHNSQMQGCPGRDIVDNRYAAYRGKLKRYVQAIVRAHLNDPRILFWQTYNEPSHATTLPLLADAYAWIKETGCSVPVSATGGGAFYGSYYSDFPTFHSYLDPNAPPAQKMVLGDGGREHLCTETLDRPGVDVPKLVNYFAERKTGWIIWELMIGRDNCRFPWGSPRGAPEPSTPFHGLIYPDGHPWSEADIKAIKQTNRQGMETQGLCISP